MTSNRPVTIYALIDPRDGRVRYVGKTIRPIGVRFSEHKARDDDGPRSRWMRKLKSLGLAPRLQVVEVVAQNDDWAARERHWIAMFRERLGKRSMLNISAGGDGASVLHTPEWNEKIAAAQRGIKRRPLSAEHRAKISVGNIGKMRGKTLPEETKAKIRLARAFQRVVISPETRAKISAAQKGKPRPPLTPEQVERWRAAQVKGMSHHRAKLNDLQVLAIRVDARSSRIVADDYGVSKSTVKMIRRGTIWKHLQVAS